MRPVQMADLEAALRLLLKTPPELRQSCMADLCARADIADRYRKRLRRLHPHYGDGSLMTAAMEQGIALRPTACDDQVLTCLQIAIAVLLDKTTHQLQ